MSGKWHPEPLTTPKADHGDSYFIKAGILSSGIREIIQGPIDHAVRINQSPVHMVFRISEIEGEGVFEYLTRGPTDSWLHQLTGTQTDAHLKALPIVAEGGVLEECNPLRVLHIEDNLDIGIQGDHSKFDFTEDDEGLPDEMSQSNIFLWLFRILQMSIPLKGRGGSWGLGKYATYLLSKFRTAFHVSTYLDEDGKPKRFALGQAHWKSRKNRPPPDSLIPVDDDGKISYGPTMWYGDEDLAIQDNPHSWLPLTDSTSINDLCSVLQINRPITSHGTSIMVPAPHNNITGNNIAQAVLANYSVAIRRGFLTVDIEDGDFSLHLDQSSIEEVIG